MTRRRLKFQEEKTTINKSVRKNNSSKKETISFDRKISAGRSKKKPVSSIDNGQKVVSDEVNFSDELNNIDQSAYNRRLESLVIYEREERKKIMIMWVGVGVFMSFIVGFWIYDTKKVFKQSRAVSANNNSDFSLNKIDDSIKNISNRLEEFKQNIEKASSTAFANTNQPVVDDVTATSSIVVPKPELIVSELQDKLATDTSTSTVDSGEVRGVSEERDIIGELKNKLENKKLQ